VVCVCVRCVCVFVWCVCVCVVCVCVCGVCVCVCLCGALVRSKLKPAFVVIPININ